MPRLELTTLARSPDLLLQHAERLGFERLELLEQTGLDQERLRDLDSRVSLRSHIRLWIRLIQRLNDPYLGLHIGAATRPRQLGLIGYLVESSRSIEDALLRLSRYSRILGDDIRLEVVRTPDRLKLILHSPIEIIVLRHPLDARVAFLADLGRKLTGQPLELCSVSLSHNGMGKSEAYEEQFGCPVVLGAPISVLELHPSTAERTVPSGDQTLGSYLSEYAQYVLEELPEPGSFRQRVEQLLGTELHSGKFALADLAALMGTSPRSFQRALADEGVSYRDVLNSYRRETACRLIAHSSLAIKEVAFLLGYQEVSAFHRAFRRFTGSSPAEYRARNGSIGEGD